MTGFRYLRTPDAARYLGLSPKTLERLRWSGEGPAFIRPPGRRFVVYDQSDLDSWVQRGRRKSTSDHGAGECASA